MSNWVELTQRFIDPTTCRPLSTEEPVCINLDFAVKLSYLSLEETELILNYGSRSDVICVKESYKQVKSLLSEEMQ
jgi:hypothetical protein